MPAAARFSVCGVVIGLSLVAACARPAPAPDAAVEATAGLGEIVDAVWAHRLERDVQARLREGLPIERLPEVSFEEARAGADFYRGIQARLAGVDRAALAHDDALTYDVIAWDAAMAVETLPFFWHFSTLAPYSGLLSPLRQIFAALPLEVPADFDAYLRLLEQVPAYVDAVRARTAGRLERGIAVSRANLAAVEVLVASSVAPADQSPFAVAEVRLGTLGDEAAAAAFQARLEEIVEGAINPALERLLALVREEVAPAAPVGVGAGVHPDGDAYYRFLVRYHTTLEITPEEAMATGEAMVAELEASMDAIQAEVGFPVDEYDREAFRAHLMAQPRFFAERPEQIGDGLMRTAHAMTARIRDYFEVVPEAPFGARRLHPALEASLTYGYYDPPTPAEPTGYYNYNGSKLESRSLLTVVGLSLHELMPGHHFQIARQLENEALAPLRRYAFPTAYTEGWGSYASYLGLEAGLAEDPYDRYGIYSLELFLANRLVVDPGMNALGWPLERARAYMREHTFESATQIASETLRYSTDMPAQALAYQIGKRKLLELRARAERALGERFDLRRFHEAVLGPGALPLAVLDSHIDWWIMQEQEEP